MFLEQKKFIKYRIVLPFIYNFIVIRRKVNETKIILHSVEYDYLEPSFSELYKKLLKQEKYKVFLVPRLTSFKSEIQFIREISDAKYIYICSTSNIIDCLPLRKETKVINLWHGCGALKKFGNSKMGGWNKKKDLYHRFRNTNLIPVTSEYCIDAFSDATGIVKEKTIIRALGSSRTDLFFDKDFLEKCRKQKENLLKEKNLDRKSKVILYAPTFHGKKLMQSYTPDFLDLTKIMEMFSDKYILLLKRHPITKNRGFPIPDKAKNFCIDVSDSFSISELICMSDILISDYSSLIFEWCLFDKPIYFLTPDLDEYVDERGFYFDFKSFINKSRCNSTEDLITAIQKSSSFDYGFIHELRHMQMSACDGNSTDRIIEAMEKL